LRHLSIHAQRKRLPRKGKQDVITGMRGAMRDTLQQKGIALRMSQV